MELKRTKIMTVKTLQLSNGINCAIEERPGSGKVSMQIHIKNGSANEKPEENGLTFLAFQATQGGTATRTREQIAEEVESKGGSIGDPNSGMLPMGRDSMIFTASS